MLMHNPFSEDVGEILFGGNIVGRKLSLNMLTTKQGYMDNQPCVYMDCSVTKKMLSLSTARPNDPNKYVKK